MSLIKNINCKNDKIPIIPLKIKKGDKLIFSDREEIVQKIKIEKNPFDKLGIPRTIRISTIEDRGDGWGILRYYSTIFDVSSYETIKKDEGRIYGLEDIN